MKHWGVSPHKIESAPRSTSNSGDLGKNLNKNKKPMKMRNYKMALKKYPVGARVHKRINLLDNDSSSEDEEARRLSYPKEGFTRQKAKSYRLQNKLSSERKRFVTLTKIDLSDDKAPVLKRDFSAKNCSSNTKTLEFKEDSTSKGVIWASKDATRSRATSDTSSKSSIRDRIKLTKLQKKAQKEDKPLTSSTLDLEKRVISNSKESLSLESPTRHKLKDKKSSYRATSNKIGFPSSVKRPNSDKQRLGA